MPAYNIEDYLNLKQSNVVWIWHGLVPVSGSSLLFGNPKQGKSFIALGLAEAVADPNITSYLGLPIDTHGRVLYIQLDTPRSLWSTGYISTVTSAASRQGVYILDKQVEDIPKMFDIRSKECQIWLRKEVDIVQPVLVIVDTIRRMHKGNENESDTMANVHDAFIECSAPAALLYLAHKKKTQQGESEDSGTVRGSSALTGAVDSLIHMTKTKLMIEARSDVEEEIAIFQQDNGTFQLNKKEDEIQVFISCIPEGTAPADENQMLSEKFGVTIRTAKRWRKAYGRT